MNEEAANFELFEFSLILFLNSECDLCLKLLYLPLPGHCLSMSHEAVDDIDVEALEWQKEGLKLRVSMDQFPLSKKYSN